MRPIDFFDEAARRFSHKIAVIDGSCALTFADLSYLSAKIASLVAARQRKPGNIAIASPNDYRVIACMLAAMRAGHAIVPVNIAASASAVADLIARTGPHCVFYSARVEPAKLAAIRQAASSASHICIDAGGSSDDLFGLSRGAEFLEDWGDIQGDDRRPAYIWQTSGTAGPPKLVIDACTSFTVSLRALRAVVRIDADSKFLAAAPLSHACGVFVLAMLTTGTTVVVLKEFDIGAMAEALTTRRISHLWMPPTALYLLLGAPEIEEIDTTALRQVMIGAAAIAPAKLREAVDKLGPTICLNYSQIESGFLTWLDERTIESAIRGDHPERLSSSGRSLGVSRIEIMDDSGRLLAPGDVGEIVVRGPSVKPYADHVQTAAARQHGWYHTGDNGYFDEEGYLYVVGRLRDVVVAGGFKISAAAIEQAILELPEIQDCAVVGLAEPTRGEEIVAIIVLAHQRDASNQAIIEQCRRLVGNNAAPTRIVRRSSLPKTPNGKNDKQRLKIEMTRTE